MRWLYGSLNILWHRLLWDGNENWPLPALWPLLSFPNLLVYWVQHFDSIIFRTWNSSAGIPSPPLALFIVMLPNAHWVQTPGCLALGEWLWLSGSWRSFLYSSSVYSCYLLISSDSVRPIPFLSFILPIFASWYFQCSWRDLCSFPLYCFPLFLCIDHLGRLSYLSWLFFGLCIQMDIFFLFSYAFSFSCSLSYL